METNTQTTPARPLRLAGKYLSFVLGRESFCIDVLQIREIIRLTDITPVPQMPDYVRGVINLRGRIIPVLDLRVRLGFVPTDDTDRSCIVVVHVKLSGGTDSPMGLIVDAVEEAINIAAADIEETPDFGADIPRDYIIGMAKVKGTVKTLLNIDRTLAGEALEHAAPAPTELPN